MIKPFDATTFARNLDPAKITRKLTIAGKEIEIPEGAETNFSALNKVDPKVKTIFCRQ